MLKMRITGGKYCGRKVVIPEGDMEIRPAMDRMRESLFAILGPLDNCSFCDLFSGSGCIGLEAASRGANQVDLVEMDISKKETLESNIQFALKDTDIKIYFSDVLRFIPSCKKQYTIVYADPPFPMPDKLRIIDEVQKNDIVEESGNFIIHIPDTEENLWPKEYENLKLTDRRLYGRNLFLFYTKI